MKAGKKISFEMESIDANYFIMNTCSIWRKAGLQNNFGK